MASFAEKKLFFQLNQITDDEHFINRILNILKTDENFEKMSAFIESGKTDKSSIISKALVLEE